MHSLPVVELARHLIRLVGPFRVVEFEDVGRIRLESPEGAARRIMHSWVDAKVEELNQCRVLMGKPPILRLPKPHLLGWEVVDQDELLVTMVNRPFNYGHFVVTSRPGDAEALYRHYLHETYGWACQLPRQKFDFWCRHQQPATATLLITSDEQMVLVQRSPDLFLHPNQIHVLGGQVEPGQTDLFTSAAEEVAGEAGVRPYDLEDWVCLGVCDNEPHQQPIFLCRCRTTLTGKQVLDSWARARDSDGPVFCRPFRRREIQRLLKHEPLTPSARALFYLVLKLNAPEGLAP